MKYTQIEITCPACKSQEATEQGKRHGHDAELNGSPMITLTTEWKCVNCDTIFTVDAKEAIHSR
jgi:hypothetical protein